MTTLAARDLAIGYGAAQPVAANIDLTIAPGAVHCLLGPNGCGKTTLFKTMLGLLPPLSGSVLIDGEPLDGLSVAERARRIAYVPQQHAPPFPFTVLDVVMMGRQARLPLFSAPGRKDRAHVLSVLGELGIETLTDADYSRLSGGQRQMVLIARALAQETRLLILDEPTASLDYGNQVLIVSQIAALARHGLAVILSTHNPHHAFACADQVTLMHRGKLIASGAPPDVLTAARLETVYGVRIAVEALDDGTRLCVPRYREIIPRRE